MVTRTLLLASDFDGTVAPIVPTPEEARIDPAIGALLARVSDQPGVAVAFVTGRETSDLRSRTAGIRAYIAGSHGVECESPDGRLVWSPKSAFVPPEAALVEDLEASGVRVELKRHGVALHFRGATITDGHQAVDRFERWAKASALELVPGRRVMEARVAGGDKRLALVKLARIARASRIVFAGDDLTDFPALRWAGQRGRSIFVMSGERNPPHAARIECIASIDRLGEILQEEIRSWRGKAGPAPRRARPLSG